MPASFYGVLLGLCCLVSAQALEPIFSKVYQTGDKPGWGAGSVQAEGEVRFLRVESANASANTLAFERIDIPEKLRGTTVTLYASVRAANITQASPPRNAAKFLVQREGPGGSALGFGVMHPETDGQWHTVSWSRQLEDNIESLRVDMGLFKCLGRLDVRALALLEGEKKDLDWEAIPAGSPTQAQEAQPVEPLAQLDRIDVTAEPFNADPKGISDSTAAIQNALDRAVATKLDNGFQQVLYFPEGTYLLSDTLTLRATNGDDPRAKDITFLGVGPGKTTLRLADNSPKFQEGNKPVVIFLEGERSNVAFFNEVRELTIDTGAGNPGATALDFIANNIGTIRNVVLKSSDPNGAGKIGLRMTRQLGGQSLISNLEVHGFDIGIEIKHPISGYTFEDILLKDQNQVGLRNDGKAVSIHRLRSSNTVPAIQNLSKAGLITVVSAELLGGAEGVMGIDNQAGGMLLRDVKIEGYGMAVNNRGETVQTLPNGLWTSDPAVGIGKMPAFLPVKDTPIVPVAEASDTFRIDTAYIESYIEKNEGAIEADAIQAALDSGKTDIVFERRGYKLYKPITIRGNVRRVDMNYGNLTPKGKDMQENWGAVITVEDTAHPVLLLEKFGVNFSHGHRYYHIQNDRNQALIIRDSMFAVGSHTYRNSGTGDLFLENFQSIFRVDNHHLKHKQAPTKDLPGKPGWVFRNQNVWARQYNPERDSRGYQELLSPHTVVDGGTFWAMGYKLGEFDGPYVEVVNGGRAEFWGGFVNTISGQPVDGRAMFVVTEGSLIVSGVERSTGAISHPIVLKGKNGEEILHAEFPYRRDDGGAIIFPLLFSSSSP